MAFTRRRPVYGCRPPCAYSARLEERRQLVRSRRLERTRKLDKSEDFVVYHSSEDEEEDYNDAAKHQILFSSNNAVDYVRAREYDSKEARSFDMHYGTRHVLSHDMLKENPVTLDMEINKIFCSSWLTNRQVAFGTKCNKLMVYNVVSKAVHQIPCLVGSNQDYAPDEPSGIQALSINPSRSLLATGGRKSNEIGVYKLPTLDPAYIAEQGHDDWIYDIAWLDDQYMASCGRDSKIAIWRVPEIEPKSTDIPSYSTISPLMVKTCKLAQKLRAFAFNKHSSELATLSTNGFVHIWDVGYLKQRITTKLPSSQEPMCMCINENESLYAVGFRTYTLLMDTRCLQLVKKITSRYSGIRVVNFKSDLLTIASSVGVVQFWDVRAQRYLESGINASRTVTLRTSRAFVNTEDDFFENNGIHNNRCTPAIYTLAYDSSGLRLFCGGGPLPSHIYGNYASVWQ